MRDAVHNSTIKFRISDRLLAAAEAKAKAEGVTLSELVRHAIRSEIRQAA